MPDTSGPWDGASWAEADWYRVMTSALPSGIHGATPATATSSGAFAFSASGLTITPAAGNATVGGAGLVRSTALTTATATTNTHASFSRRDRIVLRRSLSTHTVTLAVIAGTPASSPVAPAITRDSTTFDLPLFSFLVPPASGTTISGVLDERTWIDPAQPDISVQVASATVRGNLPATQLPTGYEVTEADTGVTWRLAPDKSWQVESSPLTLVGLSIDGLPSTFSANATSPPGFRKLTNGLIIAEGKIDVANRTYPLGQAMFTFPAGARPGIAQTFILPVGNGVARCDVTTAGVMTYGAGAVDFATPTQLSLAGTQFYAVN